MSDAKNDFLRDKIVEACSILIITHDRPDGDAYGSALGLKNFLSYYFPEKEIDVFINSKENKNRFAFMPGYNDVIYRNSECYENILNKSYDVIFCLDLGKISRIKDENIINLVMRNLDKTIYLDHHDTSEKVFCMFYLNYKTVSSTSELVAGYFIKNIFGDCEINKDAALCFYVGIVTDTGKFSYNKTSKFTHIISSKLIDTGIQKNLINYYLFHRKSIQDIDFKYYMIKNKTKYHRSLPITFLFYDYGTKFKFDPSRFSIKEVINELYGLEGTLFVFCLDEDMDEEKVNISITTITDFDVSEIAKMFNGGGHKGAAGGYFLGGIKEAHKKIMLAIKIKEKEIKEAVRKFFEI